jgi:hypothetical protein
MFRAAGRFAVRMAEMPGSTGLDQAAHGLAVDPLGSSAGRTAGATNEPQRDERPPPAPGTAMFGPGVLSDIPHPSQPLAASATEALIVRDRLELAPTVVAARTL